MCFWGANIQVLSLWSSPSKGRQNHPVTVSITKAQDVSLTAAAQAIHTPQTDRKHFLLYCAKYHQPSPFFHRRNYHLARDTLRQQMPRYGTMVSMVISVGYTCHKYPKPSDTCTAGPQERIGPSGEWICEWLDLVQHSPNFLVYPFPKVLPERLNYPFIRIIINII